jgi:hypothetical protein
LPAGESRRAFLLAKEGREGQPQRARQAAEDRPDGYGDGPVTFDADAVTRCSAVLAFRSEGFS